MAVITVDRRSPKINSIRVKLTRYLDDENTDAKPVLKLLPMGGTENLFELRAEHGFQTLKRSELKRLGRLLIELAEEENE